MSEVGHTRDRCPSTVMRFGVPVLAILLTGCHVPHGVRMALCLEPTQSCDGSGGAAMPEVPPIPASASVQTVPAVLPCPECCDPTDADGDPFDDVCGE